MSNVNQEHRILEVAKGLFTKRGFSNVAIRDICRAANVTAPTLYYYFKNKEALFDAVVRESVSMKGFITLLTDECGKSENPTSQVRAFIHTYLTGFPKERLNVGLYVRNSTELDSIGRNSLQAELTQIQSLLTGIIRSGVAEREFRETDPKMAAECLLGMMNRIVFQQIHFQRRYKQSEAVAYLYDFFLKAMRPTSEHNRA
ncbi:MAG: TetR/AcrR family transcriptional regulator [Candidatus Bathyarchaeia archaeon]